MGELGSWLRLASITSFLLGFVFIFILRPIAYALFVLWLVLGILDFINAVFGLWGKKKDSN